HGFLIGLDGQNQVDFRRGDIIADVGQVVGLYRIQKDQKGKDAVVSVLFRRRQFIVCSLVVKQRNFFRNPELFHHQTIEFVCPLVFNIIEVKQVGYVSFYHTAVDDFVVAVDIE